jgi:hypothetical protein
MGSHKTAIMKIASNPTRFAIRFTTIPYRAKKTFRRRNLIRRVLRDSHDAGFIEIRQYVVARAVPKKTDSRRRTRIARHRKGTSANRDTNQYSGCRWETEISSAEVPAGRKFSRKQTLTPFFASIVSKIPITSRHQPTHQTANHRGN